MNPASGDSERYPADEANFYSPNEAPRNLVDLAWKKIEAGGFNQNLVAPRQIQFPESFLADFNLYQFLVFFILIAVTYQFKTHNGADCEHMTYLRDEPRIAISVSVQPAHGGNTFDFDIVRPYIRYCRQFLGFGMLGRIDLYSSNPGATAVKPAMEQIYLA